MFWNNLSFKRRVGYFRGRFLQETLDKNDYHLSICKNKLIDSKIKNIDGDKFIDYDFDLSKAFFYLELIIFRINENIKNINLGSVQSSVVKGGC